MENELKTTNKAVDFLRQHAVLLLAILIGALAYICFAGTAFSYELEDETEVVLGYVGLINELPAAYGAYVYILLILPGIAVALFALSLLHRYFGLAGMACMFGSGLMNVFLAEFASYGLGYSLSFEIYSQLFTSFTLISASCSLLCVASSERLSVRDISEMGMLIGVAFVLNLLKLFSIGPDGGSVNLQMVPLFVLALRRGPVKGFIACGIVYGLLTCLTDGYGFASYPFDYLIGFGSTAVIGFFRPLIFVDESGAYSQFGENGRTAVAETFIFVAGFCATLLRMAGSTISSMVLYEYTFVAALAYNATYIPLSGLFGIIALMALYIPLTKIEKRYPVDAIRKISQE